MGEGKRCPQSWLGPAKTEDKWTSIEGQTRILIVRMQWLLPCVGIHCQLHMSYIDDESCDDLRRGTAYWVASNDTSAGQLDTRAATERDIARTNISAIANLKVHRI